MAKLEARSRRRRAVVCLSRPQVTSEVNRSGVDTQVVSCHGYLVFHPFVEQLTVFYISGLVLASFRDGEPPYTYGGLQSMPQPWPPSRGHHEYHVPKRYTNYSLVTRPSLALVLECLKYAKTEPEGLVNLTIKNWRRGRPGNEAMKTMRKSIYFIRNLLRTYIQAQPQTKTPLAPAVPAQLWASR